MKIKTLPAKFEAEVKGSGDRITKKLEVETELSSKREHHRQFGRQVLQAQRVQEKQLPGDLLDAALAQQDRFSRRHLEIPHTDKDAAATIRRNLRTTA